MIWLATKSLYSALVRTSRLGKSLRSRSATAFACSGDTPSRARARITVSCWAVKARSYSSRETKNCPKVSSLKMLATRSDVFPVFAKSTGIAEPRRRSLSLA